MVATENVMRESDNRSFQELAALWEEGYVMRCEDGHFTPSLYTITLQRYCNAVSAGRASGHRKGGSTIAEQAPRPSLPWSSCLLHLDRCHSH